VSLLRRLIVPVILATVALGVLLALPPLTTTRALAIWVVLVASIALLLLVRESRGPSHSSRFEAALQRRETEPTKQVELLRMERELVLGSADAVYAHRRFLPRLRAAAEARLASRFGVEMDRRPEVARELLGEHAWELLRPDRPEPIDRHGPGIPRAHVTALIERIESL
jgi:hypothetical protein